MAAKTPKLVDDDSEADFMQEQAATDEADSRWGEASKRVKECAGFTTEASRRLQAARTATSTPEAVRHDMQRVVQLARDIDRTANEALGLLDR